MGSTEQISEPFPARVWGWKGAPAFQVSKSSFLPQCHWRIWKEGNCAHCRSDQSTRPSSSISGAFSATIIVPGTPFLHSSFLTTLSPITLSLSLSLYAFTNALSLVLPHLLSILLSTPASHSLNPKDQVSAIFPLSGVSIEKHVRIPLERTQCVAFNMTAWSTVFIRNDKMKF